MSVQEEREYLFSRSHYGDAVDTGVSRNEAQQSHSVMCVCAHGVRQQVIAVSPVLSTYCLKFSGYTMPIPEKPVNLSPLLPSFKRK